MEETSISKKKTLINELIRGRDCTKKLQNLLRRRIVDGGSSSAENLVMKILESFSDSLSMLRSCGTDELCPAPATTYVRSACSDDRTWDSGESAKRPAPAVKDRAGCYKRRKAEDLRVEISDTFEDGYAWRKYGQKGILDAKFPRCYYRCTHKDEGCKALKQVQKQEDGSEMFHITYFGSHTCQNIKNKNKHLFSDSGDLTFFLLNFADSRISYKPSSPSTITSIHITSLSEQEDDSNAQSDDYLASSNHDTSSNYLWTDMISNLEPSCDEVFNDGVGMDDFNFN